MRAIRGIFVTVPEKLETDSVNLTTRSSSGIIADRTPVPVFEPETGHLRLVTGGFRQIVARLDGENIWVWCKAIKGEVPLTLEMLADYQEQVKAQT
jgi:hypothetical protein